MDEEEPIDLVVAIGDSVISYAAPTDVPRHHAVEMGRQLGISPVVFLGAPDGEPSPFGPISEVLTRPETVPALWDHLEVLADAGAVLGYDGATVEVLAQRLLTYSPTAATDVLLVALLPDPMSHRAAPPGVNWFVHVEPFEVPGGGLDDANHLGPPANTVVRSMISSHRRHGSVPASSTLLWDEVTFDRAHDEAAAAGSELALMLNGDGDVASFDLGTVVVRGDGAWLTPPLASGALDTAWRRALVRAGVVTEHTIAVADIEDSYGLFCITPWGVELLVGMA